MSRLSIAALQPALGAGDNLAEVIRLLRIANRRYPWAQLLLLPELAVAGPDPALAGAAGDDTEQALMALAKELGVWLVPGSLYHHQPDGGITNCCPVISADGEVVARHHKLYPFTPYERGIAPGAMAPTVFDMPGIGRVGLLVCYDLWFPEAMRALVWQGAEVVLVPTLTGTIDRDVELAMVRAQAAWNQCWVVDVNMAAPLGNGRSITCGPGGEVLHQAGDGPEMLGLDLDLAAVRHCRERGWQGLGQPLKSFRDTPMDYPQYRGGRSAALDALGPLVMPSATTDPE